jgi:DNA-binding response OmpR family regulator
MSFDSKVNLLLVDDFGEDAGMFQYALDTLPPQSATVDLRHEWSVDAACDFLRKCPEEDLPDTIVVDSCLHSETGERLLECLDFHPNLGGVPIVVLSGAQLSESDRQDARIKVHYVKPMRIAELRAIVREIVATAEKHASEREAKHVQAGAG